MKVSRLRAALAAQRPGDEPSSWNGIGTQVLLMAPPALLYFLVRSLTGDQETAAFANAASIVDLQKSLGLDWEATLQQRVLDATWLIDLVNWIYIYGHFPVLVVALAVLFRLSRSNFVALRNALVVSGAIGLVCFAFYPVAPPRLFDPEAFFDSLTELSAGYRVLQNPDLTNQFAALPSFHVGWNLLVAFALWRATSHFLVRFAVATFPVAMVTSVVLTANHWIIDVFAGAAVALAGITGAVMFERWVAPVLIPNQHALSEQTDNEPTGTTSGDPTCHEPAHT